MREKNIKKEAILNTALVLFSERGFFGTPTSLISREAGVATGTLFFYFMTKEDLIDELYRRIKAEAAAAMCRGIRSEKTIKAKIHRVGHNAVVWGMMNPLKVKFMDQFAHSPFVSTSAQEEGVSNFIFLQDLVLEGISEGIVRNIDPPLLFCMLASSFSGLVNYASFLQDPGKRAKMVEEGLAYIWNGIKA